MRGPLGPHPVDVSLQPVHCIHHDPSRRPIVQRSDPDGLTELRYRLAVGWQVLLKLRHLMSDCPYHRCACTHCGVNIEFPEPLAGTSTACPNCQTSQELVPVFEEPELLDPAAAQDPLSAAALVGAFGPPVSRPRVSILYPIGMTLPSFHDSTFPPGRSLGIISKPTWESISTG